MVHDPLYHALQCTRLLKKSWKSVVFKSKVGKNFWFLVVIFNKTIIPLALVGYEMIIANSYPAHSWNSCKLLYMWTPRNDVSLRAKTSLFSHVNFSREKISVAMHSYMINGVFRQQPRKISSEMVWYFISCVIMNRTLCGRLKTKFLCRGHVISSIIIYAAQWVDSVNIQYNNDS